MEDFACNSTFSHGMLAQQCNRDLQQFRNRALECHAPAEMNWQLWAVPQEAQRNAVQSAFCVASCDKNDLVALCILILWGTRVAVAGVIPRRHLRPPRCSQEDSDHCRRREAAERATHRRRDVKDSLSALGADAPMSAGDVAHLQLIKHGN